MIPPHLPQPLSPGASGHGRITGDSQVAATELERRFRRWGPVRARERGIRAGPARGSIEVGPLPGSATQGAHGREAAGALDRNASRCCRPWSAFRAPGLRARRREKGGDARAHRRADGQGPSQKCLGAGQARPRAIPTSVDRSDRLGDNPFQIKRVGFLAPALPAETSDFRALARITAFPPTSRQEPESGCRRSPPL